MHTAFKAFRINRTAILQFITEHCLTEEERKGKPQSIIYKPGSGFVFIKLRYDNREETTVLSERGLLKEYLKLRRR